MFRVPILQDQPTRFLNDLFADKQKKGMPFVAADGNTYHMQARDKDRTNVTGLYLGARDFMQAGDMVQFTPFEPVASVNIERNAFVMVIVPKYLQYFSALHFARKTIQEQIASGVEITDIKAAFENALNTRLTGN